jgi:parallel beta-helix repeat protein
VGVRVNGAVNRILRNEIIGNAGGGVFMSGGQIGVVPNVLGGADASRNLIGGNQGPGVEVGGGVQQISHNRIESNTGRGVHVTAGSAHRIESNTIVLSGDDAIRLDAADSIIALNRIGHVDGLGVDPRNVGNGVVIVGSNNRIQANQIVGGVSSIADAIDVVSGIGNIIVDNQIGLFGNAFVSGVGIRIRAGAGAVLRDNIVGNSLIGVALEGDGAAFCDNQIGVTPAFADVGNRGVGIRISGSGNQLRPDADPACNGDNRIGFNADHGIAIVGNNNDLRFNLIGGVETFAFGNSGAGVLLESAASGNRLEENEIHRNASHGVSLVAGSGGGNRLLANAFSANGGIGIDLGGDGMTPNDADDNDEGRNRLQNHAVFTTQAAGPGRLTIRYQIDSDTPFEATPPFRVEFYIAAPGDPPQGRLRVHVDTYNQSPNTIKTIESTFPIDTGVFNGELLAVVTDAAGNSSEFGAPVGYAVPSLEPLIFRDGFEVQPP